ncbi:MAG: FAD/NAD(P)-binding protein [Patescibacteria group bacterium]|jgi:NAD(P)H-flavin reductase
MQKNNMIPRQIKIINKIPLDEFNTLFTFKPVDFKLEKFIPGQFCMISIPGFGESAISYTSAFNPSKNSFDLGIRKVGKLTTAIGFKKIGDIVGYRGVFGNGFPLSKIKGKNILIITGGCGINPFRSLIEYIIPRRKDFGIIRMLVGAKNSDSLLYKHEYSKWEKNIEILPIVDEPAKEWTGECGIVTDLVKKHTFGGKNSIALLCGPLVMFKPSIDILLKHDFHPDDIYVSLERKMKCGFGKCQHCVCGGKYVCQHGPVFNYIEAREMEAI